MDWIADVFGDEVELVGYIAVAILIMLLALLASLIGFGCLCWRKAKGAEENLEIMLRNMKSTKQ
jgi:hypothetical protein